MKCKNCKNLIDHWCEKVIDSPDEEMDRECKHYEVMSNADRIKNMSVEEMADMLARRNLSCMPFCKECETCNQHTFKYPFCASGIKKWLESEADNNA